MVRDHTTGRTFLIALAVILLSSVVLVALGQPDRRLLKIVVLAGGARLADVTSDGRIVAYVAELDTRSGRSPLNFARTEDGTALHSTRDYPIYAIRFNPDGSLLAVAGNDGVRLIGVENGQIVRRLSGEQVFALAFSEDGHSLATGAADGKVRIWQITGELTNVFNTRDRISSLDFVAGETLAIGNSAQTGLVLESELPQSAFPIILWQIGQAKEMGRFLGHQIATTSLRFSPDGRLLVSGGSDGFVRAWQVGAAEQSWVYRVPSSLTRITKNSTVHDLCFSKDGKVIAVASDYAKILLLRASDGKLLATLSGHDGAVLKVAFVYSDELMSVSEDGTLRSWRVSPQ